MKEEKYAMLFTIINDVVFRGNRHTEEGVGSLNLLQIIPNTTIPKASISPIIDIISILRFIKPNTPL